MRRTTFGWLAVVWGLNLGVGAAPREAVSAPVEQQPARTARQAPRQIERPATVDMPNLVGLPIQAAQRHGIVVKFQLTLVAERIESADHPAGTIVRQSIPAGQAVKAGTRVVVAVAVGGIAVPSVEGQSIDIARRLLERMGFRIDIVPSQRAGASPGVVIRQAPKGGTARPRGSVVQLEVASAATDSPRDRGTPEQSQDARIAVPNFLGLDEQAAKALAGKSRLRVRLRLGFGPGKPGLVLSQSPQAGTMVHAGSTVVVTIALGLGSGPGDSTPSRDDPPQEPSDALVVLPDFAGRSEEQAMSALEELKLRSRLRRVTMGGVSPGSVFQQSPKPGTRVARGSVVELSIALAAPYEGGPSKPDGVVVPNFVGMTEKQAVETLDRLRLSSRSYRETTAAARPGVVFDQSPRAGTEVRRGAYVELRVALATPDKLPPEPPPSSEPIPTYKMSNLVGRPFEAALADGLVTQLRLQVSRLDDQTAPGRPGTVIRQSIAPDAPVSAASPLTLWVATGVAVPAVVGLSSEAAQRRLADAGLAAKIGHVTADRDPGRVIDQTPKAGVTVAHGAAVGLSVSVLETVSVPDVKGRQRGDALSIVSTSRLTGEFINDPESGLEPGLVAGQEPAAGSVVTIGTAVRMRVATGVVVPSVIGASLNDAAARIGSAGLKVESKGVRTDRGRMSAIFEQTPDPGARVARGTTVNVSVALPLLVAVPDVSGRQRGEADGVLAAAQLKAEFTNDSASELAPGTVAAQDPARDVQVPVGSVVRMRVATGVTVPALAGVSADEARTRAATSGLRANLTEVRTDSAPANSVFEQSPRAGLRVARGSLVEVSIARPPLVTVPDVVNASRSDAQRSLAATRLTVDFAEDADSTLPPDTVSFQEPAANTSVEVGTAVRVMVAAGALVPAVTRQPVRDARASLEAAGLRAIERGEFSDRVPEATVLQQSPASNTRIARGSVVSLVVAVRRTVTVPDLIGRLRVDVEQLLSPISLDARFEEAASADATIEAGTVLRQEPEAGVTVGAGTAVRVVVAPNPPTTTVPDLMGMSRADAMQLLATRSLRAEFLETNAIPPGATTGTVIQQSPLRDAVVRQGSAVQVTLAQVTTIPPGVWTRISPYVQPAIPWVAGFGVFGLVVFRFLRVNPAWSKTIRERFSRGGTDVHKSRAEPPDEPPLPHLHLEPHAGAMSSQLEVSGSSLVELELRIRTGVDPGEQHLTLDGPLIGEERRRYE
jgi:beta-lactam-binding protein with PASTA domain